MSSVLLLSLLHFLGYAAIHFSSARLMGKEYFLPKAAAVWAGYFIGTFPLLELAGAGEKILWLFFAASLWTLYILLLVVARNSVTLKLMDAIGTGIERAELDERVRGDDGLSARLDLMAKNGWLEKSSAGQFLPSRKGEVLARAALLLKRAISL